MSKQTAIALGKQKTLFVQKETSFGVLALPSSSGRVKLFKGGSVSLQEQEMHSDEQAQDSRDEFPATPGKYNAGDFNIPIYIKPSGTAGTAPDGAALFEACTGAAPSVTPAGLTCLAGSNASILKVTTGQLSAANIGDMMLVENQVVRVISHATGADDSIGISPALSAAPAVGAAIGRSVNYKLDKFVPSLSTYLKDGHTVFAQSGGLVEEAKIDIAGKEMAKIEFSGNYAKQIATGTAAVGAAGVADGIATSFPVAELAAFDIGSRFDCEAEVNIEVTAKSASTGAGTLTVVRGTGAAAHATGVATTPWLPTGTESGKQIHGKKGKLRLGSAQMKFTSLNVSLKNGNSMLNDEAGTEYASDYVEGQREVSGGVKIYFRKDSLTYYRTAQKQVQSEIIAQAGDTAGAIFAVAMPQAQMQIPAISGDNERELDIPLKGYGAGLGNNAITISFL